MRNWVAGVLAASTMLASAAVSLAADLTIGRATEQSTIDPQFARTGNNNATSEDIFDRLVAFDARLQMSPALATSWKTIDDRTWEIELRAGVKFHDGSDFTAEDVVFSMERVKTVQNSPAPLTGYLQSVESFEIVSPLTLRVKTRTPAPQLMEDIGQIAIVSRVAAKDSSQASFNSGKAAIGTGPYKFVEWVPNDRLVLKRNEDYWGRKPAYENVTIRFMPNNAGRVSAFLAGSVDLIDVVPSSDTERLRGTQGVELFSIDSGRIIYLGLNQRPGPVPFVVDRSGAPLQDNPLAKPQVRRAISKMVDRKLIVDRLLKGEGTPAGQLAPNGLGGFDPKLTPEPVDPAGARAMLAEAGYPEGFGITLHSSNDRFERDSGVAQALGQMLSRGGLTVNAVDTLPYNVYSGATTRGEYSAFLFSLGLTRSNSGSSLTSLFQTFDSDAGTGNFNRMRYSNPAFDAKLGEALAEFDEATRNGLLQEATEIAMGETAIVPLYWQKVTWAARNGVTYTANMAERTSAKDAGIAR